MRSFYFFVLAALFTISSHSEEMIHPHGYWYGVGIEKQHVFDPPLANALIRFFKKEKAETIADFGCGMGDYVKALLAADFMCEGYDGNPDTYELSDGVADVQDLSEPFDLGTRFDWVLSLEVGEHLPEAYEFIFLENLDRHASCGIILSWAIKGQGGFGHFNVQDNAYIKTAMEKLGYVNDVLSEQRLRRQSSLPWFKNTIMVFRKKKK